MPPQRSLFDRLNMGDLLGALGIIVLVTYLVMAGF